MEESGSRRIGGGKTGLDELGWRKIWVGMGSLAVGWLSWDQWIGGRIG